MWELYHKEGWALKNWCFRTVVLEKTLESPLDCKETQPVNLKEINWIFTGRTDAEAEAPILWSYDAKSWLTRKDPDARKEWVQEDKGATEDEMAGWHHWLNGQESERILGDSEGQGSLEGCSPWVCKELDMSEWLNNKFLQNHGNFQMHKNRKTKPVNLYMFITQSWQLLTFFWPSKMILKEVYCSFNARTLALD